MLAERQIFKVIIHCIYNFIGEHNNNKKAQHFPGKLTSPVCSSTRKKEKDGAPANVGTSVGVFSELSRANHGAEDPVSPLLPGSVAHPQHDGHRCAGQYAFLGDHHVHKLWRCDIVHEVEKAQ